MTIKQQGGIFGRNPSFNEAEANVLNVDNIKIDGNTISSTDTNGNINITPNGSGKTLLNGTAIGGLYSSRFYFGAGAVGLWFDTSNNAIRGFNAGTPGLNNGNIDIGLADSRFKDIHLAGNVVIGTSGNGIDFSATSGTGTSELFDDYEEGTWTPAFTTTGTDFSSITYDTQSGHYTKVGRLVTARGFIRTDAITVGSASGSVLISGLPYTSTSPAVGSVGVTYNWGGDVPLSVTIFNSATTLYMYYRTSVNGIDNAIAPSDMGTGANNNDIYFTISYMAS